MWVWEEQLPAQQVGRPRPGPGAGWAVKAAGPGWHQGKEAPGWHQGKRVQQLRIVQEGRKAALYNRQCQWKWVDGFRATFPQKFHVVTWQLCPIRAAE